MDHYMMTIVLVAVAVATVLVYVGVGEVLPRRWRKNEVEASEDFAINSVNVLIGLLFSILLAFVIAGVLSDFDKASNNTQEEANALGAIYGFGQGISEPGKSTWKRDIRHYAALVVEKEPLTNTGRSDQRGCPRLYVVLPHQRGAAGRALTIVDQTAPDRPSADRGGATKRSIGLLPLPGQRAQSSFQW